MKHASNNYIPSNKTNETKWNTPNRIPTGPQTIKPKKLTHEYAHTRSFGGHRILLTKLSYQTFVRRCTEQIKETIFQKPFIHLLRGKGYTLLKPHSKLHSQTKIIFRYFTIQHISAAIQTVLNKIINHATERNLPLLL